jgi:hypothetical protein
MDFLSNESVAPRWVLTARASVWITDRISSPRFLLSDALVNAHDRVLES